MFYLDESWHVIFIRENHIWLENHIVLSHINFDIISVISDNSKEKLTVH